MPADNLSRLMLDEADIAPSPMFAARVMEAVRREAEPPPIAFPWTRALPGLLGLAVSLVVVFVLTLVSSGGPGVAIAAVDWWLDAASKYNAGWVVAALMLSWASVTISLRLRGAAL